MRSLHWVLQNLDLVGLGIVIVWLVISQRRMRKYLPAPVRKLIMDPGVQSVIRLLAERTLGNKDRREIAVNAVKQIATDRGVELPARHVNLVVELVVNKLRNDGVLTTPAAASLAPGESHPGDYSPVIIEPALPLSSDLPADKTPASETVTSETLTSETLTSKTPTGETLTSEILTSEILTSETLSPDLIPAEPLLIEEPVSEPPPAEPEPPRLPPAAPQK